MDKTVSILVHFRTNTIQAQKINTVCLLAVMDIFVDVQVASVNVQKIVLCLFLKGVKDNIKVFQVGRRNEVLINTTKN